MWKLTIEDDEAQRTSLDLNQTEYTIGRGEETDIRLTERNVSRTHCLIRLNSEVWEIVDEGSYNGTYVNGERVTAEGTALANGDVVNIGDYRIELLDAAEQEKEEAEPRQRRPDRLVMVIGPSPGKEYSLDGDVHTIGRAEEAFVSINHASVSRMHAELHDLGNSRWEVVDHSSSNGIRINGVELRRGIIEPGDALELGDVRLRFVAAGKFFRPAVDLSQQLPAMPFEAMAPAAGAGSSQNKLGMIVVIIAALAGLSVAAYLAFSDSKMTAPPVAPSAGPLDLEQARAILESAQKHAANGDLQLAHKQLDRIPEDSLVREEKSLRDIENKWADEMFGKAAKTQDPEEKVRILTLISDAVSVSTERRKEAARQAVSVKPIDDLDKPHHKPRPGKPSPPRPSSPGSAEPDNPSPDPPDIDPDPDPQPAPTSNPNASAKARLQGRMMSGKASVTELKQLKALCMLDGDRACRSAAMAAIAAKNKK